MLSMSIPLQRMLTIADLQPSQVDEAMQLFDQLPASSEGQPAWPCRHSHVGLGRYSWRWTITA